MKDYRLYILMRTDLPSMGAGRAAAQASHAANAFIHAFGPESKCPRVEVREWQRQTKQGFGTAIVLAATGPQIHYLMAAPPLRNWIMMGKVYDPDYVITVNQEVADLMKQGYTPKFCKYTFDPRPDKSVAIHRNEMTCAFVFGEPDDEALVEIRKLPLYG